MHQNVTKLSKKILTIMLQLGFNYTTVKLTNLRIQDLIIDVDNATFDINIPIALANKKVSLFKNLNKRNTLHKSNYM
jgi:hypothetical protein